MLLAGFLHAGQLIGLKFVTVNISPIEGRGIHGETGSDSAIGADDDIVLAGATIPFGKLQFTVGTLHEAGGPCKASSDITVSPGSITVPAKALKVAAARHANERFDLLQTLHGIHHLIAGLVLFDEPIDEGIDVSPIFRPDIGGIVAEMLEVLVLLKHRRLR